VSVDQAAVHNPDRPIRVKGIVVPGSYQTAEGSTDPHLLDRRAKEGARPS
jgi:hypothetical protein